MSRGLAVDDTCAAAPVPVEEGRVAVVGLVAAEEEGAANMGLRRNMEQSRRTCMYARGRTKLPRLDAVLEEVMTEEGEAWEEVMLDYSLVRASLPSRAETVK